VCSTECIIDEILSVGGKLLSEFRVVILFLGMESNVFKKHHFTWLQLITSLSDFRSHTVSEKMYIGLEE
jgi:hypothetical protein